MRKMMNVKVALMFGLAIAGLTLICGEKQVEARPNFKKIWADTYPNSKMLIDKKCGICHPGKTKKEKSAYGQAVGKGLSKRKETDKNKIVKALKDAEKMPSPTEGKTFGDYIEKDELPPVGEVKE